MTIAILYQEAAGKNRASKKKDKIDNFNERKYDEVMLKIYPFKALRYNKNKINIEQVLSAPYDIIDTDEQTELYARAKQNIIRLILGKVSDTDTAENNRYTRAKKTLAAWKENEIFIQDKDPGLYCYEHHFTKDGKQFVLRGLMATMELVDLEAGIIVPHENTLKGPIEDRLKLYEACECQFSAIYTLYADKDAHIETYIDQVKKQPPLYDVQAETLGGNYQLWGIYDKETIKKLQQLFKEKTLYIADGHHRYKTARQYQEKQQASAGETQNELANRCFVLMANLYDEGIHIYPTHRSCFDLSARQLDNLTKGLNIYFKQDICTSKDELKKKISEKQAESAIGVIFPDRRYICISVKDWAQVNHFFKEGISDDLKQVDVTLLHSVILEALLSLTPSSISKQENLRYIKDDKQVFQEIEEGKAQVGFLLNALPLETLKKLSDNRDKMPQKSTYFEPKLITGLVINPLSD
ncbi:MAG: DUF1015 domain-containing protein [bacterium]